MTRYPNLTAEDLEALKALPMLAGAMVVTLDGAGVGEAGREMLASARIVAEATALFPGNPLISQLHRELHDPESYKNMPSTEPKLKTSNTAVAMEAFVVVLDNALNILDEKIADIDAQGYKEWVLACAQAGSEAAKEGSTLGFGGKRISDTEAAYLQHLRTRLGLD